MDQAKILPYLTKETEKWVKIAEEKYGRKFPMPSVSLKLKGGTAGIANSSKCEIRYNAALFLRHQKDFAERTVPHEVAHILTDAIFNQVEATSTIRFRSGRVKPHGREWRSVMHTLGIKNVTRCHSYDTTGIRKKRSKPYKAICGCDEKSITKTIYTRMKSGAGYTCRQCNQRMKLESDDVFSATDVFSAATKSARSSTPKTHFTKTIGVAKPYKYKCTCTIHRVSRTIHNRIQNEGSVRRCGKCKGPVAKINYVGIGYEHNKERT